MSAKLTSVLPSVEMVDSLPAEALPAIIAQLAALQARIAARMAVEPACGPAKVLSADGDKDECLTVTDVAALLRRRPQYVYDLLRRGVLPGMTLGKYKLIRRTDFRAFLQRHLDNAVDTQGYLTYHPKDERRGSAPGAPQARTDPGAARQAGRGRPQQRRALGARRARHQGVGGSPDARSGSGAAHPTDTE